MSGASPSAPESTSEITPEREFEIALETLEGALEYHFIDRSRLVHALQHSSFSHDRRADRAAGRSNERLEFLGDSVLGLVVAHALYAAKPDWDEGRLTRALHSIVERRSLAPLARSLGVGPALRLGRTERQSSGEDKDSILADAMEAIIGAIYLDGGLAAARAFIERVFSDALAADAPEVERDPKTALQERTMAETGAFPSYAVIRDSEIEGDDDRFEVEVVLEDVRLATAIGRTKRAAERKAAARALRQWEKREPVDARPDEES